MTLHSRPPANSLSPDDWDLIKDIVFTCLPLDGLARERWLEEHPPPEHVRREVDRLLAASRTSVGFMDVPAPQRVLDLPAAHPERIAHFRIDHVLGVGGMGVVYAGVDERLGRPVAVKVLQAEDATDDARRKRLLWDARAASTLNHPNIVCVYETGEAEGVEYVAMELVSGTTLADLLEREPLQQARALSLATQIAAALEAAHAHGIVHRDLKPSNVMITASGVAKLVDFGLAKNVGGDIADGHAPTTIEGRLAGTVAYMSPEQAEGADIDFRSDIFSFGSLLYEMLTRQRAFEGGSTVSVLARVIHTEPAAPRALSPALDPRLEEIVQRCLRKDRERRFQSMAEVRVRLQEAIDEPVAKAVVHHSRPSRRRWIGALALVSAAGVGAIVTAVMLGREQRPGPVTLSRLTWDGGLTTAPSISADGSMIAYASDRSGRGDLDIWVQKSGGGDPIRVTLDPADDSAPSISPNGAQIAFRSERAGGGVYVVSLGGSERLLASGCRDPKYSPDGKMIACWKGDVGNKFYRGSAHIFLVSSSGGPLQPFQEKLQAAALPLWLPDSTGLIFLGRDTDASGKSIVDWWTASIDKADARPTGVLADLEARGLKAPLGNFFIRPEAWQASTLLFTARREDATSVWGMDASDRGALKGRQLQRWLWHGTGLWNWAIPKLDRDGRDGIRYSEYEPPRPVTLGAVVEALPTAPDQTASPSLVFASLSVESRLRRMRLASNTPHAQAEHLLPNILEIGSPSVSADGRLLVFSVRQPNGYRVVAVDRATENPKPVTTVESTPFVRVILSGDGKIIVYSGSNNTGFRMKLGGVPERICEGCSWPTHLSYDGSEALFESPDEPERLLLWSDGKMRPLIGGSSRANVRQFAGRFSPGGLWVALCAAPRERAEREIFVVPNTRGGAVADDQWVSISDGETTDREPYWSPDGKRLFFISERDGFRCVWARPMDPRTGRPTGPAYPVAHFHHARELLRSPVPQWGAIGLTASDDSIIFTIAETTGNLWWRRESPAR